MNAVPPDESSSPELAPRRMLDGGGGEPARSLVESAQLDRVPSGAKERVAAALRAVLEPDGALPCEPGPAGRGDALPRLAARSGLYVVGTGVVAAIALGVWLRATPSESSSVGSTPAGAAAPPPRAAAPGADPAAGRSPAELAESAKQAAPIHPGQPTRPGELTLQAPTPQVEHGERQARSDMARATPGRPKPEGDGSQGAAFDSGLLAEVRMIRAVSAAIDAGQAGRAEHELEAYRRRFARGELAVEADVLQIQIAAMRGDDASASAAAKLLLARPEARHYRARVRSLLEGEAERTGSTNRGNARGSRSNDAAVDMRARR